jgi:hypothetical protein
LAWCWPSRATACSWCCCRSGFFFGFALGAQAIQALFGEAFLASITSWVVGFIVAAVFAVLAYLFYMAAVALLAFSLGYGATVALLTAIGLPLVGGFIAWVVAVVVGAARLRGVRFNIRSGSSRLRRPSWGGRLSWGVCACCSAARRRKCWRIRCSLC